jgi:glucan phosphoethanolaminetransferase (alkaline phosphatase superfamily)
MIQRPQSIFLAIVVLAQSFVGYGWPIWTKTGISGQSAELTNTHWTISQNGAMVNEHSHIFLALLLISSTLLTILILFSFKNRVRQMTLGLVNSLLIAGSMAYTFWIIFKQAMPVFEPENQGAYGFGFYAMVVALLANMIANRLIRKDEMLVQSSNRMR